MNTTSKKSVVKGWTYLLMFALVINIVYPSNLLIAVIACFTIGWLALSESRISIKLDFSTFNLILMFAIICLVTTSKVAIDDYSFALKTKSYFVPFFILLFFILDRFRVFQLAAMQSLQWMLILFIFLFYLQFATFLLFDYYLDFLSLAGIREAKPNFYLSIFGITNFVRCTSIFNEPGTYCSYVAVMIATAINCGVISQRKNKKLIASALVSMLLSFSGFGVVMVTLIVLALSIETMKKNGRTFKFKPIYLLVGLIVIALTTLLAAKYFESRLTENGDQRSGFLFRAILIEKFLSSSIEEKILGRDFHQRVINISDYEDYSTYPEDLGMWFFWLYWYGIFFLIWFIFTLIKFLKVPYAWAAVILLSKGTGFSYLVVFVCLWNIKNRRFNES